MNISESELWVLHEASEDDGLELWQLVYDVHFADPQQEIFEVYRSACQYIVSMIEKGLVTFTARRYKKTGEIEIALDSEVPVPLEDVPQVLRQPRNWDRSFGIDREIYEIVTTEAGEGLLDAMMKD